ncbi:BA75_04870T0 [Komagataella pastoris]|uniref:BA75_04870T0 n=1 Tax=Komagataella pastoris TaxID=4922 RepID=A0A1B2JIH4_PICPA|nr:BA75_04870T0 [Komagataella pastoris]
MDPSQEQREWQEQSFASPQPQNGTIIEDFVFAVGIINFHHIRGPEIEYWLDTEGKSPLDPEKIASINERWPYLSFEALPDGAHMFTECFSEFSLVFDQSSLFGCACVRQVDRADLINNEDREYTRSTVQKAVVLITRYPITIQLREQLSIITMTFFEQMDFRDREIVQLFYDNIRARYRHVKILNDDPFETLTENSSSENGDGALKIIKESDFYVGLDLKHLVLGLKRNLLILLKALLLEKRIMFYSKNLMKLFNSQMSFLSLIPNLLLNLQDCSDPSLNSLSQNRTKLTSLKTSDRTSMLNFIGLPLKLFDKGGFFQPYLTLQQNEVLTQKNTLWYLIGTSNDLFLNQRHKIADIVVHVDHLGESSIEILNEDLKPSLSLTNADKKFIDFIVHQVKLAHLENEGGSGSNTINNFNLSKSFNGGNEFIRNNLEDYLIGLLSTLKYEKFLENATPTQLNSLIPMGNTNHTQLHSDVKHYNELFISEYRKSNNYQIFDDSTDDELFNFFEPTHAANLIASPNIWDKMAKPFQKLRR